MLKQVFTLFWEINLQIAFFHIYCMLTWDRRKYLKISRLHTSLLSINVRFPLIYSIPELYMDFRISDQSVAHSPVNDSHL